MKKLFTTFVLVCNLLISVNSEAAVNWIKFPYFSNAGGLNDQQSTTEIQDNEATDIQNIIFDTGYALTKRYGYLTIPINADERVATGACIATSAVTGLAYYKMDDDNRHIVAIVQNDSKAEAKKKTYSSGGEVSTTAPWDSIDFEPLPTGYANTNLCDFVVARDALVFTVGLNTAKPFKWTGTGKVQYLTTDTDCPNATIVEYHKNQLFLAGNNTYPSRVYFSELDSITSFIATDFFDCETSDGTKVRSLLSAYDALYMFKDESIWRLSGYERDSFRLEKMVDGVGTLSNQSPTATNTGIYFVSAQGDVFHYDGAYTATNVSGKISLSLDNIDRTKIQYCLGAGFSTYKFNDVDYFVAFTTSMSTKNDVIFLFDTGYKAWTKFKGFYPLSWCVGDDDEGGKALFFGDYDGRVHRYPSESYYDGNIATTAIAALYQTKWFRYPEVGLGDKYWRLLKTYALSADGVYLHAECKSDYEASGKVVDINLQSSQANWDVDLWDVALWGGTAIITGRNEIDKGVSMFQIRYYNEEVDEGFTLLGWENFIQSSDRI